MLLDPEFDVVEVERSERGTQRVFGILAFGKIAQVAAKDVAVARSPRSGMAKSQDWA